MKTKVLLLLQIVLLSAISLNAQRGVRIGYINTEYILENIPEYKNASSQLEAKVQEWKSEIDTRLTEIDNKREALNNEKPLLTQELYNERNEDITFEEQEILDYQQKRFGPNGDLMIQKQQLIKPIQDQIFAAVQDIAATKQYDFIFDKSADVVMLYSADRFDISELVIRALNRTAKREQAQTKEEREAAEEEDVVPEINDAREAREQALEDKRAERKKLMEQRRQEVLEAREANRREAEERRQQILEERKKARQERLGNTEDDSVTDKAADKTPETDTKAKEAKNDAAAKASEDNNDAIEAEKKEREERRQQILDEREARKKELEDRRKQILEEREKARQERLDKINSDKNSTTE